MSKYAIPEMLRRGKGVIVNIISVAGIRPLPLAMPYSVSKAGLIMLTKSMAVEYGNRGIRVNAVAPGWLVRQWLLGPRLPMGQRMRTSQKCSFKGYPLADLLIQPR